MSLVGCRIIGPFTIWASLSPQNCRVLPAEDNSSDDPSSVALPPSRSTRSLKTTSKPQISRGKTKALDSQMEAKARETSPHRHTYKENTQNYQNQKTHFESNDPRNISASPMPGRSTQLTDLLGVSQLPFNIQRTIIFICSLKENGAVAQWVKSSLHEHEDLILTLRNPCGKARNGSVPAIPVWRRWCQEYVCLGLAGQPAWFSC